MQLQNETSVLNYRQASPFLQMTRCLQNVLNEEKSVHRYTHAAPYETFAFFVKKEIFESTIDANHFFPNVSNNILFAS